MKFSNYNKSGFSLVEVSLALMVVAVGLSVLVVMFPAGLDQNIIAGEETQAAFFAEDVFSRLQAMGSSQPWEKFLSDAAEIPIPSTIANTDKLYLDNAIHTIEFKLEDNTYTDLTMRYRIKRVERGPVLKVTIEVWSGEWGATAAADARTFYTEVYDSGL